MTPGGMWETSKAELIEHLEARAEAAEERVAGLESEVALYRAALEWIRDRYPSTAGEVARDALKGERA